jgi:hypothetical protein
VTAGVLRGDRARFQLFGDTVNTAARVESTGTKNRIHVSQDTADLLIAAGKRSWIVARETKVNAKGKGLMQTYWIDTKDIRVIDWNVEILKSLLKEVVARRESVGAQADSPHVIKISERQILDMESAPFNELMSSFHIPKYTASEKDVNPSKVEIDPVVISQLQDFVLSISETYNENAFHNFDHASHVTMSVVKLLKRIVVPAEGSEDKGPIHDGSYGITSDPLTKFTVALSALIHDVEHTGVPNAQLVQEEDPLAHQYNGKSVAEQNSVDVAWSLLMQNRFKDLRGVLYTNEEELQRFRQMLVHTVLATDIMDKELSMKRKERWYQTFGSDETASMPSTSEGGVGY